MSAVAKTMRVLVGYASRFGSTRDIAIRIADAVRTRGSSEVDVRSVEDISDVDRYDAMVFGSGVYDGSWTAEATALMRRYAGVLRASRCGCSALARSAIHIPLSAA